MLNIKMATISTSNSTQLSMLPSHNGGNDSRTGHQTEYGWCGQCGISIDWLNWQLQTMQKEVRPEVVLIHFLSLAVSVMNFLHCSLHS